MASAGPPLATAGATSEASTAPGRCRIHEATKPVRGRRSASSRPPARMPKVTAAMPMMVMKASSDIGGPLPGFDYCAGKAADEAADDDVPVAGDQLRRSNGRQRRDDPGHEVALALPHAQEQRDEGGSEGE